MPALSNSRPNSVKTLSHPRIAAAALFFVAAAAIHALATAAAPAAAKPAAAPASSAASAAIKGDPALNALLEKRRLRKLEAAKPVRLVNINGASRKDLMTLPGVDAAVADKIIAGRPYLTKAELVTKNVIPTGPYLSLKNNVVALQKQPLKTKP